MKKILIILSILFFGNVAVYSQTPVDFIYINGSNNNSNKMHDWFIQGINKFHPVLKKHLENDAFTYKHMLKNGEYVIEQKPSNYFWGYKSQYDLRFMQEKAKMLRSVSPFVAYFVRNTISDVMHDAIWVYKSHNMIPIVQELDEQIKEDVKQGKKVVLLGYSAGAFITFEYLLTRIPYIDIAEWFENQKLDEDVKQMMKKYPRKKTCATAFINSNLTNMNALNRIITNNNKNEFKEDYMKMDEYTDKYCIPDGAVIGVINYASPIPLFYSDITDPRIDRGLFVGLLYKHLIEEDFFFLTVNYADDPLGFPNDVNYTNKELEEVYNVKFKSTKGFFYDYSDDISRKTFIGAHTSYWNTKGRFAKAIVKGYTNGYKLQYDD